MTKKIIKIMALPQIRGSATFTSYIRRVAVYARVSTSSDEQLMSIEAQKDYYPKYIASHPNWEYMGLYADEGLSGTSSKRREEFNRMIADAINGKFDLIITKSVSRFARNTVDTLSAVRKLKNAGVEVFFEKEQIFSFDSKGEFILTLLSSIAQEESRSISENVIWGQRKRFADGKYSLPYARFLGYRKGADGKPEIVEEEAAIVRKIYRLYLEGRTPSNIAAILESKGADSPGGKKKWQVRTIMSILTNEKYYGAALLQKSFTVDFLTKKKQQNNGELPRYYIEHDHDAIISKAVFDEVQKRMDQPGKSNASHYPFSNKIICGGCGGIYGRKIDGSYSNNKEYRRAVWRCNRKYSARGKSHAPVINEDALVLAFNMTVLEIWKSEAKIRSLCRRILSKTIHADKHNGSRTSRQKAIDSFLSTLCDISPTCIEFDDSSWRILVQQVSVSLDEKLEFCLINGNFYAQPLLKPHEFKKIIHQKTKEGRKLTPPLQLKD